MELRFEIPERKTEVILVKRLKGANRWEYSNGNITQLSSEFKVLGSYKIENDLTVLGFSCMLSEDQLNKVMPIKEDLRYADRNDMTGYLDYGPKHKDGKPYWYHSSVDSFKSFLESNGIFNVNPYAGPDGNAININWFNGPGGFIDGELLSMSQYTKKFNFHEERKGDWLVLTKPMQEKEMYWKLSDNNSLSDIFENFNDVTIAILDDIGDIEPSDRAKVSYTITPIYLTEKEYSDIVNKNFK